MGLGTTMTGLLMVFATTFEFRLVCDPPTQLLDLIMRGCKCAASRTMGFEGCCWWERVFAVLRETAFKQGWLPTLASDFPLSFLDDTLLFRSTQVWPRRAWGLTGNCFPKESSTPVLINIVVFTLGFKD